MARRSFLGILAGFLATALSSAAERPAAVPLEGIRTGSGASARFEPTGGVFRLAAAEAIEAYVAAAPDAFLCRIAPAVNTDVVQLSIGRVDESPLQLPSIAHRATKRSPSRPHGWNSRWQGDRYRLKAQGPLRSASSAST